MPKLDRSRLRRHARALLAGAALFALSAFFLHGSFLFVDIARSNLCATGSSTNCFENETAVVETGDGSSEFVVTSPGGGGETVGPYNGSWDDTPAPGTEVVLERWEGDEIAFVYVPETGSRYKTRGAPDRENPAAFAVLLAFLAVAVPWHIVTQRPIVTKRR